MKRAGNSAIVKKATYVNLINNGLVSFRRAYTDLHYVGNADDGNARRLRELGEAVCLFSVQQLFDLMDDADRQSLYNALVESAGGDFLRDLKKLSPLTEHGFREILEKCAGSAVTILLTNVNVNQNHFEWFVDHLNRP